MNAPGPRIGLLLAGGAGQRIGGTKALTPLAGRPLIAHAVDRLLPQIDLLLISSADGQPPPGLVSEAATAVLSDGPFVGAGPLAGILAALDWVAGHHPPCLELLSAPLDCPFLPPDLAERLLLGQPGSPVIRVAGSFGRRHPVTAAWPVALRSALHSFLTGGNSRVGEFLDQNPTQTIEWTEADDPFFNVNTPTDLILAETRLSDAG